MPLKIKKEMFVGETDKPSSGGNSDPSYLLYLYQRIAGAL